MRLNKLFACFILLLMAAPLARAQHDIHLRARLDDTQKTLHIDQHITYRNTTQRPLTHLIFNDWNNAYSTKDSPLARRFSDEFVRSFYLSDPFERGHTTIHKLSAKGSDLPWTRPEGQPDLIQLALLQPLLPGAELSLHIEYTVKLPSDKFTRYGFSASGDYALKDWYLCPARPTDTDFVRYSNLGIDDMAGATSNISLVVHAPSHFELTSDLEETQKTTLDTERVHTFTGDNRQHSVLYLTREPVFHSYNNDQIEVRLGFKDEKVTDIQKALIVDRIVNFTAEHIGDFPHPALVVSEADYAKNPFYGLNQLPAFISPFSDAFAFELRFLKTYLHQFLVSSMRLDPRKDNWVYDGLQVYAMMHYIDLHYPCAKMMGTLSKWKLLKSFNIINLDFNQQYSYYYMLMARKNLDQPIGAPKDELIKFNAQIAGKYRAGLSLAYLDNYLGMDKVPASIREFYALAASEPANAATFEHILEARAQKDIEWFFGTVIHSRKLIDYKFVGKVNKTQDSVQLTLSNRTGTRVPIPVYGVRGKDVVFKQWIDGVTTDSTLTFPSTGADKIAINYRNEVPEYNLRNNWKSLRNFSIGNRPLKFNLMKDLEDPYYNQLLYVPHFEYNHYDGVSLGLRLHNKTILDKPFTFDVTPVYSSKKHQLIGSASLAFNQFLRDGNLYQIRYSLSGNYFHYAPDAAYYRLNPMISFRFRDEDFRLNKKQQLIMRHVVVHRDPTNFVLDNAEQNENYGVFNLRYFHTEHELVKTTNYQGDLQFSQNFGKAIFTADYRKLFENNRQVNLRFFFGAFLYNQTTNDFFSFALDRPTDYLFDYNYYGRSEDTGLLSQQLIMSEGGFKSRLDTPFANRWMATVNASTSVWNWIEIYADAGLVKNRLENAAFVYDSGVRLNLVTDYLELYFPVYSNNGWEISQRAYAEKIRFIVVIDPKTLVNLFTRKWF